MDKIWNYLAKKGIRPERVQLEWVSAAEGGKFQKVMKEMDKLRKTVTADEIKETMEILSKDKKLKTVFMFEQAMRATVKSEEE